MSPRRPRPRPLEPLGLLRRAGLLALLALGSTTACDDAAPDLSGLPAPVPEPAQGLRPEAARGRVPEQAHVVDYWIDARLDEHTHEIRGTLRMAWRNPTERTVDRLPFHLYMNAFRAEDTTWMSEARGEHRKQAFARDRWGFVEVARVEQLVFEGEQAELSLERPAAHERRALRFAEDADPTTMSVTLGEPLGPGGSIVVELEFLTRLPRVFARTGYMGDFHMAGQWFPKIGVLEEEAGWQAHVFGLNSEFYADFGDYEVFLDVPASYVVGASGVRVDELELEGDRKRLHYRAQMVHDFAWAADPDFIEHYGEYEGIRIRQLIQPEHLDDAGAHMEAQKLALASMEARFGPYPWSTITIVHAPEGAGGAGGMEYPTLYTTTDMAPLDALPAWIGRERVVGLFTTIHEFGHQYFQGLFASNEHAQPWLDEGMNTTANLLVYMDSYGEDPWMFEVLGHPLTITDFVPASLMNSATLDPIDQPASRFDALLDSYPAVTYQKTAAVMLSLRELCGRELWDQAMARYAELARFGHPKGALLEQVLVETIGGADGRLALVGEGGPGSVWLDVQDYLDQGLRGTDLADFRVTRIGNRRRLGASGWHRRAAQAPEAPPPEPNPILRSAEQGLDALLGAEPEPEPDGPEGLAWTPSPDDWGRAVGKLDDERVEGYVIIERRSSFRVPVELLVVFEDGERETLMWDGRARHHRFDFPGRRVASATLDPRHILMIEPHKLDNSALIPALRKQGEPLSDWLGDLSETASLAVLGGLAL